MHQTRKSIRLPHYDYALAGVYFVTICTYQRQCILGEVKDDKVVMSELGQLVANEWQQLLEHYPNLELDTFVVMPNHMHGLLCFRTVIKHEGSINRTPKLGEVVRAFKARVTRTAKMTLGFEQPLWQRNYYEHIVRGENDLAAIREYIANNPLQWHLDKENPNA